MRFKPRSLDPVIRRVINGVIKLYFRNELHLFWFAPTCFEHIAIRGRPRQLTASGDVEVEVNHGLAALIAAADDHAVAVYKSLPWSSSSESSAGECGS